MTGCATGQDAVTGTPGGPATSDSRVSGSSRYGGKGSPRAPVFRPMPLEETDVLHHRPTLAVPAAATVSSLTRADMGVAFQPIVDVRDGSVLAHEVLARCSRPGLTSPAVLFERAEDEGACGPLGRLVREVAFAECDDSPLFVNVHPDELTARWLVQPDDPMVLHGHDVYLEITETAAFTHFDLCMSVLLELRRRVDVRLVIDDFGAGHSNLQRVVELEPSVVKLDLTLTRAIDGHRRKQAVVRHVVNLCNELDTRVVAEGVETEAELACVRDLGVHLAQGYFLARPARLPPTPYWPWARRTGHDSAQRRAVRDETPSRSRIKAVEEISALTTRRPGYR